MDPSFGLCWCDMGPLPWSDHLLNFRWETRTTHGTLMSRHKCWCEEVSVVVTTLFSYTRDYFWCVWFTFTLRREGDGFVWYDKWTTVRGLIPSRRNLRQGVARGVYSGPSSGTIPVKAVGHYWFGEVRSLTSSVGSRVWRKEWNFGGEWGWHLVLSLRPKSDGERSRSVPGEDTKARLENRDYRLLWFSFSTRIPFSFNSKPQ